MLSIFENIINEPLLINDNSLLNKIHTESKNISIYFNESIKQFPKLFNDNFQTLDEALKYLKEISSPNKYVCAKLIKDIPGWTCTECSKYTDSIFCHDCYKKSKNLHKGHHLYFLPNSGGMCGCGEPEALYTFCPEHSGPHIEQKQINEFISKIFPKDILEKIKPFFNKFFLKFSNFFVLTEKCQYFYPEILEKKFEDINKEENSDNINEKEYINSLKNNFSIAFQNLLDFLRGFFNSLNHNFKFLFHYYFLRVIYKLIV